MWGQSKGLHSYHSLRYGEPDGRPRLPSCRVVACWDQRQPYALEIGTRGKPERYVYLRAAL